MTPWIRPANLLDAGRTGGILTEFQTDTTWMPDLHSGAENIGFCDRMIARGWMTVAGFGDTVAGFLAREGRDIHALYVAGKMRGKSLGACLLTDAQAQAPELVLWTFQANAAALRFYQKHGFQEVARGDGSGNDEGLPDVKMVWTREAGA